MKLWKNKKKGSIQDIFTIGLVLFVMSIIIIIVYVVSDNLNTEFQASDQLEGHGKASFGSINDMFPGVVDNTFLFIMISLAILAFVLAALVRVHPIFLIPYIIVLILVIFFAGIFSNVYQEIAAQDQVTALADNLTFITQIMSFLPFIIGIFGTILAIVMYKLWSVNQ